MAATKSKEGGFEGFVTSSKGITLSIISLCVWVFTLLLYKMAIAIGIFKDDDSNFQTFCLFCSFILSLIIGIFISKNIYNKTDNFRFIGVLINIFLIYTSANGIQAGNAAFSRPSSTDNARSPDKMALFGFFDPRPWLPDATSKKKIETLTEENKNLNSLMDQYKANDQSGQIKRLNDRINNFVKENNELKREIQVLQGNGNLQGELNQLREENTNLRNQWNNYLDRIYKYISIRNEWTNRANSDPKFASFASRIKESLIPFKFSNDYYNQLFFYDLTPPK